MTYYVHNVPGRLRVRIPAVKGNSARAVDVENLLSNVFGVGSSTVSTVTGSVIINYDPNLINAQNVLDRLRQKGYYDPSRAVGTDQALEGKIQRTSEIIGKALLGHVVERAFEGSALSLLAVLI